VASRHEESEWRTAEKNETAARQWRANPRLLRAFCVAGTGSLPRQVHCGAARAFLDVSGPNWCRDPLAGGCTSGVRCGPGTQAPCCQTWALLLTWSGFAPRWHRSTTGRVQSSSPGAGLKGDVVVVQKLTTQWRAGASPWASSCCSWRSLLVTKAFFIVHSYCASSMLEDLSLLPISQSF